MSIFDSDRPRRVGTQAEEATDDDLREVVRRVRALEDRQLIISGEDGTNGRLGNLRKEVDGHSGLIKWLLGGLSGSAITAIAAIYIAGQKDGANQQWKAYQDAAIAELRAQVRQLQGERVPTWPLKGDDR